MHRDPVFTPLAAPGAGWMGSPQLAQVTAVGGRDGFSVQVRLLAFEPEAAGDTTMWARIVAPMAGDQRGLFCLPDVGDEVLVVFAQGDARHPLVLGGLWNGASAPPATVEGSGENRTKRLRSKNGLQITLEDERGQETLTLETPGGQKVTLKDGPGNLKIEDSNGNSIELATAGITITASAKVTVSASKVEISAGLVTVDAGMSKFSGVVKCDTLISNTVVSSAYTPGAGNVW